MKIRPPSAFIFYVKYDDTFSSGAGSKIKILQLVVVTLRILLTIGWFW
jgi:hypothetical protein